MSTTLHSWFINLA